MSLGFMPATPFWFIGHISCFQIPLWDFQMNLRLFMVSHELASLSQSITFLPAQSKTVQRFQKSGTPKPQCTQMILTEIWTKLKWNAQERCLFFLAASLTGFTVLSLENRCKRTWCQRECYCSSRILFTKSNDTGLANVHIWGFLPLFHEV